MDDFIPRAHVSHLQPLRVHYRDLGRRDREAADRAAAHYHAPDLPRRQLLLHRDVAAAVADDYALQPRRLPDQRLSVELLWFRRRGRWPEPVDDVTLPDHLPDDGVVDLQDWLPAKGVT